ncbi:DUF218 domain-containing protein [Sphingomonas gellani]|uniref:DUF218 domain-containing protein n=1 Tax=Sphingomonas gellani TaxID=1166340 RepID=A0A1H8HJE5_9SPHN|nr:YdcF family protein [Sphingomonas gellani]SEN56352.1 DUF218 domain-containing protein [Sphingomonas gellani]
MDARPRRLAVVFGAAVRADGGASPTLARRVGHAAALAQRDPSVDLFCSGGVGRYPPAEAEVMAALLDGLVAPERVILDTESRDTLESVRAAAALVRDGGYAECLACTDPYHQPRVRMLFAMQGVRCRPLPFSDRGPSPLRRRMWMREAAAVPYDLVAGLRAAWRDRRGRS